MDSQWNYNYDDNDDKQQQQNQDGNDFEYQIIAPLPLNSYPSDYSDPPVLSYSYSGISNASSNQDYHMTNFQYQEPAPSIIFLEPEQLYNSIFKLVTEINDSLMLSQDLIVYLLYRYKWSRIKLHEDYYDYSQLYHAKNIQILQYKQQCKNYVQKQQQCQICCSPQILIKSPLCLHKYCRQCWGSYIKQQLNRGIIFFPCMRKCEISPILPFVFIKRHFPNLLGLYLKKICINYVNINKQISYCPSTNNQNCSLFCQQSTSLTNSTSQMVTWVECKCGQYFCFKCREQPHFPLPCQDVAKWSNVTNIEQGSIQWIQKNTKKCPDCSASVQKYIGCHYIKCVCGAQFCYQCTKSWDKNHKDRKGQCLLSLKKKSSLQERTTTNVFLELQQKLMAINRTLKKNIQTINSLKKFISLNFKQQEWAIEKLKQIKRQIQQTWHNYKWSLIGLFIYRKQAIDELIEDQFIESITNLMESVEKIEKLGKMISFRELLIIKNQMMSKIQLLRKNRIIWLDAWRSC